MAKMLALNSKFVNFGLLAPKRVKIRALLFNAAVPNCQFS